MGLIVLLILTFLVILIVSRKLMRKGIPLLIIVLLQLSYYLSS
jgi:hypothetical protein